MGVPGPAGNDRLGVLVNSGGRSSQLLWKNNNTDYRKVPKFLDTKKLCCNQPKIHITGPNLRVLHQKDANGKANSEDPDQTAPITV